MIKMAPLLLITLIASACANLRPPQIIEGHPVAYDSISSGKIQVSATKKVENQDVCFDIALDLRGVHQHQASVSNWSLAWVDEKNHYHLLSLNQRDPASVPQGTEGKYKEWTNHFRTCTPKAKFAEVKGLVLTPRDLPYHDSRSLKLNWK